MLLLLLMQRWRLLKTQWLVLPMRWLTPRPALPMLHKQLVMRLPVALLQSMLLPVQLVALLTLLALLWKKRVPRTNRARMTAVLALGAIAPRMHLPS